MNQNSLLRTDKEFLALYERNVNRIYRICYLHLRSTADAQDATQTVFYKFIRSGKTFASEEHEKAWFIVTARNHCRDMFKLPWRRAYVACIDDFAETVADKRNDYSELMDALMRLPVKYKEVLYLHYFEGYTAKEIAGLLKRNENTVYTQMAKGRERLKKDLGEDDENA